MITCGGCGGQTCEGKSGMEIEVPQAFVTPQSPDTRHEIKMVPETLVTLV